MEGLVSVLHDSVAEARDIKQHLGRWERFREMWPKRREIDSLTSILVNMDEWCGKACFCAV